MSEVRLQVKHVSKNFGITKALKDVSFNINKGEVHALIGENGSGKSTMTNMLTGIYTLESGQFILDGKEVHPKNQVEANEEGISIIVQELGTLSGLTVAENIFLGHEDQFVHLGIKNTAAMNKKANELLQSYGFDKIKAGDMIDDYNFEDRKLVEIVKATYFNPKIVVVDETTTALSQEGREELYKQMNRVRDNGNTVIFISHDLPEILDKSDFFPFFRRCGCTAALLVTAVGDHIDFSFFYQDFHNLRKLRPFCFRHLQQHGNVFQTHRLIVFRAYEIHEQRLAVFQQFRTSGTRMARMTAMVPAVLSCMGRRTALRIFPPIFFLLIIFHLLSPLCRKRHPYAFSWE